MKIIIDENIFNKWALPLHFDNEKSSEWILYGGAGSGKSYAVATHLILQALQQPYFRCLYLRKVQRTIRGSQFLLFKDIINTFKLNDLFKIKENDMTIECTITGNQLIAAGVDKVEKLKSVQEPNCIWMEEATEFTEKDYMQLKLRLRTPKAHNYMILTFNPVSQQHWLYKHLQRTTDKVVIKTTYLDNKYVDEGYKETMRQLKEIDEDYYNVYALGEWGNSSKELIYPKYKIFNGDWQDIEGESFYGLDFGFSNPTALVECKIVGDNLYVRELLYKTNLTNEALINKLKEMNIDRYSYIYCDTANADRIQALYDAGFNVYASNKDVLFGIQQVNSYNIFIDSASSNLLKEISMYKFAVDKFGNVIDRPVKYNDHLMDAMRYAVTTHSETLGLKSEIKVIKHKIKYYD